MLGSHRSDEEDGFIGYVCVECLGQGYRGTVGGQPEGRYASGQHICVCWCVGVPGRGVCMGTEVCMGVSL